MLPALNISLYEISQSQPIDVGSMFTDGEVAAAGRAMRLCHTSKSDDGWHRSHFGSHPRMLVATQHSAVSLLDLRVSPNSISLSSTLQILISF